MTYMEGLKSGLMSLVGMAMLWFLLIKPHLDKYSKKERRKEKMFEGYAIYDEMRDLVSNIRLDSGTETEISKIRKKLKFYENWLKSPEAFFLVRKERLKWIKRITFALGK